MRLSNILLGISLMILVSTGFLLFLTNGVNKYNPTVPTDYNKSFAKIQNNLDELGSIANDGDEKVSNITSTSGISNDFLGFFFGKAYQAVEPIILGVNLQKEIIDAGVDEGLSATGYGDTIKAVGNLLIGLFILLLFIAIAVKSEWI